MSYYDKALAVDMESFGVAREIFKQRGATFHSPEYLIVRSISDLVNPESADLDNQQTRERWKVYAAEAAAAFALRVLLDCLDATRGLFEAPAETTAATASATGAPEAAKI